MLSHPASPAPWDRGCSPPVRSRLGFLPRGCPWPSSPPPVVYRSPETGGAPGPPPRRSAETGAPGPPGAGPAATGWLSQGAAPGMRDWAPGRGTPDLPVRVPSCGACLQHVLLLSQERDLPVDGHPGQPHGPPQPRAAPRDSSGVGGGGGV